MTVSITHPAPEPAHLPEADVAADEHLLRLIAGSEVDATAPVSREHALKTAHYRQFLEALGVAMYTTDAEGRITSFNEAAAEFWGRRPDLGEEWCGSFKLLYPDERPMAHDACPMAIALKERRAVRGGEAIAVRPDGTKVPFMAFPTPIFDDDGELVGAVNVLIDITDRQRAEAATREAGRALAASNAVRDEFLGLVSHELRTPVTTIFGNARLLQARAAELDESVKASMLADMAADADRLHSIIENLLHLTRLGSGTPPELEPQVLDRVVERSVRAFRSRHRGRQIELLSSTPRAVVEADETDLGLLVENLLTNADKYSEPTSPIEIEVSVEGDEVVVEVRDRGIGFGDTPPETLFEPFYRSEEAQFAATGLGIGLALCQRIVDAIHGRIWAKPRDGGGAVIGFALPYQKPSLDLF
jgi:PAS domain S-box-containing protein